MRYTSLDTETELPTDKVGLATKRLARRRQGKDTARSSCGRDTGGAEADEVRRTAREGAMAVGAWQDYLAGLGTIQRRAIGWKQSLG